MRAHATGYGGDQCGTAPVHRSAPHMPIPARSRAASELGQRGQRLTALVAETRVATGAVLPAPPVQRTANHEHGVRRAGSHQTQCFCEHFSSARSDFAHARSSTARQSAEVASRLRRCAHEAKRSRPSALTDGREFSRFPFARAVTHEHLRCRAPEGAQAWPRIARMRSSSACQS